MGETLFDAGPAAPTITAVAPWFGSNRMLGPKVAEELRGCKWVGVPFAGGMSELAFIRASTIVVGDLHRHVINLALCIKNDQARKLLAETLADVPFHPDSLEAAHASCLEIEKLEATKKPLNAASLGWAVHYFITCWMGRSTKPGTEGEFSGKLPVRWGATGGDSNTRYRSAVASLEAWGEIMRRCNFVVQDAFEFLGNVGDRPDHGLYIDAPWPDDGDKYRHKFSTTDQRRLAEKLSTFTRARVVVRYGDHPLIRELYPEPRWHWRRLTGRTQANEGKAEVLILNGPSYAEAGCE